MKRYRIDQVSAWIIAVVISLGVFGLVFLGLKYLGEKIIAHDEEMLAEAEIKSKTSDPPMEEEEEAEPEAKMDMAPSPPSKMMHSTTWSYSGSTGPRNWGQLDPEYKKCQTGKKQSPIDINTPKGNPDLKAINIEYLTGHSSMQNNGNSILVDPAEGNFIHFEEERYELQQFHFHMPSEHSIDGIPYDMEVHLIHKNSAQQLLIVALLLEEGQTPLNGLKKLWANLPPKGKDYAIENFNPRDLFPKGLNYYYYSGSLSKPPCTEGVHWLVMKSPVSISSKQIDQFLQVYRNNSRPIQSLNKRNIYIYQG